MFELLAGLMLLQTGATPFELDSPYAKPTLSGFVAIANNRIVDGVSYTDGDGVFSAGVIYAHPDGLFAGSEFVFSRGNGINLPSDSLPALQTFVGLTRAVGRHRFAIELLDYRVDAGEYGRLDHQGIGLRYRRGAFQIELAHENDKAYFYHYEDRFFRYDLDRLAIGWQQPLGDNLAWSAGAGASRIGTIGVDYGYFTGNLQGRFRGMHWQIAYTRAGEDLEEFYGGQVDRGQLLLRITVPFRVF